MPDLLQCKNTTCRQTWPNPERLEGSKTINMSKCPKCGSEAKRVGHY